MSISNIIQTFDDLKRFLIVSDPRVFLSKVRGLVIVPGGGGKSTIVKSFQEKTIACSDIDDYWDRDQGNDKVLQLTADWTAACKADDFIRRHQIEDEYVLLKAKSSKTKWLTESTSDLLFVQTCGQAAALMDDGMCVTLNLLPTARLHHENLYKRAGNQHPPQDLNVCQRQWQENYKQYPYILYDDFNEFQRLVILLHQFILEMRKTSLE